MMPRLLTALLILGFPLLAQATTLHVRSSGGDCSTPQGCIDRLQPGDILLIHSGTYPGFALRRLSGREGALITIKAAPGEKAVLDAAVGTGDEYGVISANSPHYLVIGDADGTLEITNSDPWVADAKRLDIS